ncbi:MAG: hypothetical protein GXO10_06365 [Crenarchaeota archaeon]|nr:hypothetical protein [Thermoproteota archaeon]
MAVHEFIEKYQDIVRKWSYEKELENALNLIENFRAPFSSEAELFRKILEDFAWTQTFDLILKITTENYVNDILNEIRRKIIDKYLGRYLGTDIASKLLEIIEEELVDRNLNVRLFYEILIRALEQAKDAIRGVFPLIFTLVENVITIFALQILVDCKHINVRELDREYIEFIQKLSSDPNVREQAMTLGSFIVYICDEDKKVIKYKA